MIGVLVSGEGTNLQALIDAGLPIACVASNKPGVRALERAEEAGIETAVFDHHDYESREERDVALAEWLQPRLDGASIPDGFTRDRLPVPRAVVQSLASLSHSHRPLARR